MEYRAFDGRRENAHTNAGIAIAITTNKIKGGNNQASIMEDIINIMPNKNFPNVKISGRNLNIKYARTIPSAIDITRCIISVLTYIIISFYVVDVSETKILPGMMFWEIE